MRKIHSPLFCVSICLIFIAWGFPLAVSGASSTWSNTDTDWNTASSWGGTLPPSGTQLAVGAAFSNPEATNPNLSASYTTGGLYFTTASASGYTISSSSSSITLTLTSYGSTGTQGNWAIYAQNTGGTNLVSAPIVLDPRAGGTTRNIAVFGQVAGGTLTIGGPITQTGTSTDLWLTGAGTINITGTDNSYSGGTGQTGNVGGTAITGGITVGIASLGNSGSNGSLGTGAIEIGGLAPGGSSSTAGTLDYMGSGENSNKTITLGGNATINTAGATGALVLSGATLDSTSASKTLTLTGSNIGNEISSSITTNGSTALIKAGTGSWTLSGSNTYSGGTSVNGGTLLVNNASGSGTGSGSVTVASGATIGGSGTIGLTGTSKFTVISGGLLAPGVSGSTTSPLTITAAGSSNTVALSGAKLAFNLGAANTASCLNLIGSFANQVTGLSGNTLTFTDLTSGHLALGEYTLIQSDDSTTNPFSGLSLGTLSGFIINGLSGDTVALELNRLTGTNDYALQLDIQAESAVPEPSAWAMMIGGLSMLAFWRRCQRGLLQK